MRELPLHYAFPVLVPWRGGPFVLCRDGSLSAFIETSGRDPDGLSSEAYVDTTLVAANAMTPLPPAVRAQTYFWHAQDRAPVPRPRGHAIVDRIESARHAHLSGKKLYRTRLLTVLSLPTSALAGSSEFTDLVSSIFVAPFDAEARKRLQRLFSLSSTLTYLESTLDAATRALHDSVDTYCRRWSLHAETRLLDTAEVWTWCRALATLDPKTFATPAPAPADHWYASMLHGRAYTCTVNGTEYLKLETPTRYARACSLVRFHGRIEPGFWARSTPAAITVPGDFVLATNTRHLDAIQKTLTFGNARNEIERQRFKLMAAMLRTDNDRDPTQKVHDRRAEELAQAESTVDRWARSQVLAVAIGDTPEEARSTSLALDTSFSQASITPVWEVPGLFDAYRALQPGAAANRPRELVISGIKAAAIGLHYRYSQGATTVADLNGEEPLMYLETLDGQAFGLSPFVGEKGTVLGIGATRTGKTFFKNCSAAHGAKYDGIFAALDFDHGSEPLVKLFGNDAALFRHDTGMNPFAVADRSGPFRAHLTELVLAMLRANDDPSMRELAEGEQALLDQALEATLALPKELQSLSDFATHLPKSMRQKLGRWLRNGEGRYAGLLDAQTDRVGMLERRITAFNLAGIKSDAAALGPVVTEILWRIRLAIEDLSRLRQVKRVAFDEAHLVLRHPVIGPFIAYLCRTAAKHRGSVELWSHLPEEFAEARDWPAIRAAASTLMFTAVPDADRDRYMSVFNITAADVEIIRTLTPKRDVYVIQPDTGLRKRLVFDADPTIRQLMSSRAVDVADQRDRDAVALCA